MMAEHNTSLSSEGSNPDLTKTTHLPSSNFLQKLHRREIRERFQNLGIDNPHPLYPELPPRLKFPWTNLVSDSVIHDGHVFVGFTNDGHYVISYTMHIDVDLPTTFPTHCYKLYFWKFVPHKPLKKVATVKLFRGFDIDSELLIKFCQWPLDSNKLVIHGCSLVTDPDPRVTQYPCYITITGVPSILPCEECNVSGVGICPDEDDDDWTNRQTKCLLHAFVLHLEYNLVSPFPSFDPRISLKKNGTVVINTGDTLIALSIATDVCNAGVTNVRGPSTSIQETALKLSLANDDEHPGCTPCSSTNVNGTESEPSATAQLFAGVWECSSPSSSSGVELFTSPFRKSRYRWQIQRLEINEDEKWESSLSDVTASEVTDVSDATAEFPSTPLKSSKQTLKLCRGSTDVQVETYSMAAYEEPKHTKNIYIESFKENVSPSSDIRTHGTRPGAISSRRTSDINCSCHLLDVESSPSFSQSQATNCITTVTQVFLPHVEGDVSETGVADDDVGNSPYHSSLALEVYWPTTTKLAPRSMTALENANGPSLVVKQNVFDLEPFVNETAELLCNVTGKVYQAFTDYDVQLVDVLDETGDVLALVMILVQASSKNKGHPNCHSCTSGPVRNLYESAYLFLWNILTGMYKVIDTCMLREIEMLKGKAVIPRPWNPGRKTCALLQEKWLLPCSPMQEVLVLDNVPALKGTSLDELYSPERDVAIIRPRLIIT